jgi:hypothetical protein
MSPSGGRGASGLDHGAAVNAKRAFAVTAALVLVGLVTMARMEGGPARPAVAAAVVNTTTTTTVVTTTTTGVATTSSTIAPGTVAVAVLNGAGTAHGATYYQQKLAALGWKTLAPADAKLSNLPASQLFVVSAAYEQAAATLAHQLGLPDSDVVTPTSANDAAVPPSDLQQADLVLLIGMDLASQVPAGYSG